jgi:hypothetical protein
MVGAMAGMVLAGCGGSNSSSDPLPSIYAGTWSGSWSGPLSNDGGTLTFAVSADGSLSGSMSRAGNIAGSISGIINSTGKLTATTAFPTSGNFIISGQVVAQPGILSGSFNYSWLGENYTGTFSETSQSSTSTGTGA